MATQDQTRVPLYSSEEFVFAQHFDDEDEEEASRGKGGLLEGRGIWSCLGGLISSGWGLG